MFLFLYRLEGLVLHFHSKSKAFVLIKVCLGTTKTSVQETMFLSKVMESLTFIWHVFAKYEYRKADRYLFIYYFYFFVLRIIPHRLLGPPDGLDCRFSVFTHSHIGQTSQPFVAAYTMSPQPP